MSRFNTDTSYLTDGARTTFPLPFVGGWVTKQMVRAEFTPLGGAPSALTLLTDQIGATQLTIDPPLPTGVIRVYRDSAGASITDFLTRSVSREGLNSAVAQALHAAAEAYDLSATAREVSTAALALVEDLPPSDWPDNAITVDALIGANSALWADGAPVRALGRAAPDDLGGGLFYFSRAATTTVDNGLVFAPTGGGRLHRAGWSALGFRGTAIPQWWGAIADSSPSTFTGTECAPAIAAAMRSAASVYLPPGFYLCSNNSAGGQLLVTRDVAVRGAGNSTSVILFNDDASLSRRDLFAADKLGTWNVLFEDFGVIGSWGRTNWTTTRSHLAELEDIGDFTANRIRLSYGRFMALVITGCRDFRVTDSHVSFMLADGIRAREYRTAHVSGCVLRAVNDDSIAVHTDDASPDVLTDSNVVVSNNVIVDSQGIAILGGRRVYVGGNTLVRTHCRSIFVGTDTGSGEGNTTIHSATIVDNVIVDHLDATVFYLGSGGLVPPITVFPSPPTPIAGVGVPGRPDGAGGIVQPWPYLMRNNVDNTGGGMGALNLIIRGNTVTRTMAPMGQLYSAYGYGVRYARGGPVDPEVTATLLGLNSVNNYACIRVGGAVWNASVAGNILSAGFPIGIHFSDAVGLSAFRTIVNAEVRNNIVSQFTGIGLFVDCDGSVTEDGNVWDADPYHVAASRGGSGTWVSSNVPQGVYAAQSALILLGSSSFKNMQRVGTFATAPARVSVLGEPIIYCNPVSLGEHNSNVGVRNPGNAPGSRYVIEDGNPSSSTYGTVLNSCPVAAASQPTTGTWVQGFVVCNSAPSVLGTAGSRYTVAGWVRLTTGASNVAGTDWSERRVLTGT